MVRGCELFRWIDTCLAHLVKKFKKYNWYDKAEYEGMQVQNGHSSGITYGTRLGVVP